MLTVARVSQGWNFGFGERDYAFLGEELVVARNLRHGSYTHRDIVSGNLTQALHASTCYWYSRSQKVGI